jgi:hypothetical protein
LIKAQKIQELQLILMEKCGQPFYLTSALMKNNNYIIKINLFFTGL